MNLLLKNATAQHPLFSRDSNAIITMYLPLQPRDANSGTCPSGTIAGAVLGSIAGTLLILWLIYTLRAGLNPTSNTKSTSEVVNRPRSHRSHRSSRSRSARRSSRTIYVDENGNRVPPPPRAYYKPE